MGISQVGWLKASFSDDFDDTCFYFFLQQVEEQAQRIADLKESLAQKEALYLATCEKLCSSENKRIELETSLVSLATSDVVDGKRSTFSKCKSPSLTSTNTCMYLNALPC